MAVKLLGDGRGFINTTDIPAYSGNLTVCFWLRLDTAEAVTERVIYSLHDDPWSAASWQISTKADVLELYLWNGVTEADTYRDADSALTIGTWYHVAITTSGSTHKLYVNGIQEGEDLTVDLGSMAAEIGELLGSASGQVGLFSVGYFRLWRATLSGAEIQAEMASATAVRTANLYRDVPLKTVDGSDVSGNGYDLVDVDPLGMEVVDGPVPSSSPSMSASVSASVSPSSSTSPSRSSSASPSTSTSPSRSASSSPSSSESASNSASRSGSPAPDEVVVTQLVVEADTHRVAPLAVTQLATEPSTHRAVPLRISQSAVETIINEYLALWCSNLVVETVIGKALPSSVIPPIVRAIRRLRQSPHLSDEQTWLFISSFQLDLETGRGVTTGQGIDPQIMCQWSDDGGHTWSEESWVSAGVQGAYQWRAIWRRLGKSRDRVWRVVVSDPVPWRFLDAYISVEKGTA